MLVIFSSLTSTTASASSFSFLPRSFGGAPPEAFLRKVGAKPVWLKLSFKALSEDKILELRKCVWYPLPSLPIFLHHMHCVPICMLRCSNDACIICVYRHC